MHKPSERIVVVGGPRCGKSTYAREMRELGYPTFCGDPRSAVKEPEDGVTYLIEGLGFGSKASEWIVENWLPMPGPWVLEGHVMARVLRKWLAQALTEGLGSVGRGGDYPCDRVVLFSRQRQELDLKPGQVSLHEGTMTIWNQIAYDFERITEER